MDSCEVNYNKKVQWKIPRESISDILLNKKNGLLFLDVESAGKINFTNDNCSEEICHKKIKVDGMDYSNGDKDSVETPLSIVNFHTHPLNCYIQEQCIWGWPSGEDLGQCLNFAKEGNLTHIVFTIEGSYIINVNHDFIREFNDDDDFKTILNSIIEIFKLTHIYRIVPNLNKKSKYFKSKKDLEDKFYINFLKPIELKSKSNILYSWINLVNSLTLEKLNKLWLKNKNKTGKINNLVKNLELNKLKKKYLN